MTSKFKVGDKVVPVSKSYGDSFDDCKHAKKLKDNEVNFLYVVGFQGELILLNSNKTSFNSGSYYKESDLNKYSSKNQRLSVLEERVGKLEDYDRSSYKHIEALEKEINELKVIVHQLRRPSTIVEDVIKFEGQQYKKVDREAREGDVVVFDSTIYPHNAEPNKPYIVNRKTPHGVGHYDEVTTCDVKFVIYDHGRTPETVDVYELIVEDKSKFQGITIEIDAPKSANQQRAEIIEKAKKFLEEKGKGFDFSINNNKRILAYNIRTEKVAFARCHPNDVFNEHIGKAIALGRALGLDVSEFENAVQPLEFAVGQNCVISNWAGHNGNKLTITKLLDGKRAYHSYMDGWLGFDTLTIINDTNAEYEVNA